MKNKFVLIFMLGIMVPVIHSCKKEDTVVLSVTLDGTAYQIDGSSITVANSGSNYIFTITLNNIPLYMYLPSLKAGTYKFSTGYNPGPGMLLSGANGETYITVKNNVPARGAIVISSNSGSSITGTFSGVTYPEPNGTLIYTDSTTITNGTFTNMAY